MGSTRHVPRGLGKRVCMQGNGCCQLSSATDQLISYVGSYCFLLISYSCLIIYIYIYICVRSLVLRGRQGHRSKTFTMNRIITSNTFVFQTCFKHIFNLCKTLFKLCKIIYILFSFLLFRFIKRMVCYLFSIQIRICYAVIRIKETKLACAISSKNIISLVG